MRFGQEAEGFFRIPIENLRVLLRLWDIDIDNDKTSYYELLAVADYLERLGLDVYFREEIKTILHRVFRFVLLSKIEYGRPLHKAPATARSLPHFEYSRALGLSLFL